MLEVRAFEPEDFFIDEFPFPREELDEAHISFVIPYGVSAGLIEWNESGGTISLIGNRFNILNRRTTTRYRVWPAILKFLRRSESSDGFELMVPDSYDGPVPLIWSDDPSSNPRPS